MLFAHQKGLLVKQQMMRLSPLVAFLLIWALWYAPVGEAEELTHYRWVGPSNASTQEAAFLALVSRVFGSAALSHLVPDVAVWLHLSAVPPGGVGPNRTGDWFKYNCAQSKLRIEASSANAAGAAFHDYLRNYMNSSVTWGFNRTGWNIEVPPSGRLPDTPTRPANPTSSSSSVEKDDSGEETYWIQSSSLGPYRYHMNVCTLGYTMVFWSWKEWEEHIDWMALHGINLPLASTGSEWIWYRTWSEGFNMTDDDILSYFTGPAFLPWLRMGNIHRWAGPMSVAYLKDQAALAKLILNRMSELGMNPILPAFDGHIPNALQKLYPDAAISRSPDWLGGGPEWSENLLLAPTDPLFQSIASVFMKKLSEEFGVASFYNADTYNEMAPSSWDAAYLHNSSAAVYRGLSTYNPAAQWIMQGWAFLADGNWTATNIQAYLGGVPHSGLVILDLTSDLFPQFPRTNGYFGYRWIWCMLHNYGGRRGIYGDVQRIATSPFTDYALYPSMIGTGLTMEAIDTNLIIYELMLEVSWRAGVGMDATALNDWILTYYRSRYGSAAEPNSLLASFPMMQQNGPMTKMVACCFHFGVEVNRPWISNTAGPNGMGLGSLTWVDYDPDTVVAALVAIKYDVIVSGLTETSKTFHYDAIDLARQVLSNIFAELQLVYTPLLNDMGTTYQDLRQFHETMSSILQQLERLMSTDVNFLFGRWLEAANTISAGLSQTEKELFQFNARTQVTTWGPEGLVHDYAGKPWGGLLAGYHLPRWQYLFQWIESQFNASDPGTVVSSLNRTLFTSQIYNDIEYPFTLRNDSSKFPSAPIGSAREEFTAVHEEWLRDYKQSEVTVLDHSRLEGGFILSELTWHKMDSVLFHVCRHLPRCVGFDSTGRLYGDRPRGSIVAASGVSLYLLAGR